MKIVNRLLILIVIVGGVWFLAKNWNTASTTSTPVVNDAEIVADIDADANSTNTVEKVRDPMTPVITPASTPKIEFEKKTKTTVPVVTEPTKKYVEPAAITKKATHIRVYLYEWDVDISDKTISSGPIVFEVHNTGKFTHHFAVEGVKDFGKVIPGATENFSITLPADDYTLISPREVDTFHEMRETLFVD